MTSVCLLMFSDGRDEYHARSYASVGDMVLGFDHVVTVDDPDHKLGFSGAYAEGFERAAASGADYVFGVELDFTFRRPVPLAAMVDVLEHDPSLVQMVLLRQPWNEAEKAAGGIVQQCPETYERREHRGSPYLAHRNFCSTNPALWPMWVVARGWPRVPQSEGMFSLALFAESPEYRSAFWGAGEVWTDHIGMIRSGIGY